MSKFTSELEKATPAWHQLITPTKYNRTLAKKALLDESVQVRLTRCLERRFRLSASCAAFRQDMGDKGEVEGEPITEEAERTIKHGRLTMSVAAAVDLVEFLSREPAAPAHATKLLAVQGMPDALKVQLKRIEKMSR